MDINHPYHDIFSTDAFQREVWECKLWQGITGGKAKVLRLSALQRPSKMRMQEDFSGSGGGGDRLVLRPLQVIHEVRCSPLLHNSAAGTASALRAIVLA